MTTLRSCEVAGLASQVAVLAAMAETTGLGAAGWCAGLGYAVAGCAVLGRALERAGSPGLGPAGRVTLLRAVLVGGVAALVADSLVRPVAVAPLVAIAAVALVLDAVDGAVARRTGTCSPLGARFDMEVDAFLLLVLSAYATQLVGGWVLVIGALRYAYLAAGWLLPWLDGPLRYRYWGKVVAATQGIVLVVVAADVLPRPLAATALALAVAMLAESFTWCVAYRWKHRHAPAAVTSEPAPVASRARDAIFIPV